MRFAFPVAALSLILLLVGLGGISFAQSSGPGNVTTLYIGGNVSGGPWTAALQDIGQPNSSGISPADFAIYYSGKLTNVSSMYPNMTSTFVFDNASLHITVLQTFAGSYSSQSWAKINAWAVIPYSTTTTSLPAPTTTSIAQNTTTVEQRPTTTVPQNVSANTPNPGGPCIAVGGGPCVAAPSGIIAKLVGILKGALGWLASAFGK